MPIFINENKNKKPKNFIEAVEELILNYQFEILTEDVKNELKCEFKKLKKKYSFCAKTDLIINETEISVIIDNKVLNRMVLIEKNHDR